VNGKVSPSHSDSSKEASLPGLSKFPSLPNRTEMQNAMQPKSQATVTPLRFGKNGSVRPVGPLVDSDTRNVRLEDASSLRSTLPCTRSPSSSCASLLSAHTFSHPTASAPSLRIENPHEYIASLLSPLPFQLLGMYQSMMSKDIQQALHLKQLIDNWRNQKNPGWLISSVSNVLSVPISISHAAEERICVPKIHKIVLNDLPSPFDQGTYSLSAHSSAEKDCGINLADLLFLRRTESVPIIRQHIDFADTLLLPLRFRPSECSIHFQLTHSSEGVVADCSINPSSLSDVPSNSFFPLTLSLLPTSSRFTFTDSTFRVSLFFLNWSPSIHVEDRQKQSFLSSAGSSHSKTKTSMKRKQAATAKVHSRKSLFDLSALRSPPVTPSDGISSKKFKESILVHLDVLDKETRKIVGVVVTNSFGCGFISQDEFLMKALSSSPSSSTLEVNPTALFYMKSKSSSQNGEVSTYFIFYNSHTGVPLSIPPSLKSGSKLLKRFKMDQHGALFAISSKESCAIVVDNVSKMMCVSEAETDGTAFYYSVVPHDSLMCDVTTHTPKTSTLPLPLSSSRSFSASPTMLVPPLRIATSPAMPCVSDSTPPFLMFFSAQPDFNDVVWENGRVVSGPPSLLLLGILCHPDQSVFDNDSFILAETYLSYTSTAVFLETINASVKFMKEKSCDLDGFSRRFVSFLGKLLEFHVYLSSLFDKQTISRRNIAESTTLLKFLTEEILVSAFLGGSEKEKLNAICQRLHESLSLSSFDRFQAILQRSYPTQLPSDVIERVSLLSTSSHDIANDLTIYFHLLFSQIRPTELYHLMWSKHPEKSQNITSLIDVFNLGSKWFVMEILKEELLPSRVNAIESAISVMSSLVKLRNFYGALMVFSALSHSAIGRLKLSWEKIGKKKLKKMKKCEGLFSSEFNWKGYRDALAQSVPPAIPNLSLYLQDVTFIEEGNQDFVGPNQNSLNFYKMRLWSSVLQSLRKYQDVSYELGEMTTNLIKYLRRMDIKSEEDCYSLSLLYEPRKGAPGLHQSSDANANKGTSTTPHDAMKGLSLGGPSSRKKKERVKAVKSTTMVMDSAVSFAHREDEERNHSTPLRNDREGSNQNGPTTSKNQPTRRTSLPSYRFAELVPRGMVENSEATLSSTSSNSSANVSPVFDISNQRTSKNIIASPLNKDLFAKRFLESTSPLPAKINEPTRQMSGSQGLVIPLPITIPVDLNSMSSSLSLSSVISDHSRSLVQLPVSDPFIELFVNILTFHAIGEQLCDAESEYSASVIATLLETKISLTSLISYFTRECSEVIYIHSFINRSKLKPNDFSLQELQHFLSNSLVICRKFAVKLFFQRRNDDEMILDYQYAENLLHQLLVNYRLVYTDDFVTPFLIERCHLVCLGVYTMNSFLFLSLTSGTENISSISRYFQVGAGFLEALSLLLHETTSQTSMSTFIEVITKVKECIGSNKLTDTADDFVMLSMKEKVSFKVMATAFKDLFEPFLEKEGLRTLFEMTQDFLKDICGLIQTRAVQSYRLIFQRFCLSIQEILHEMLKVSLFHVEQSICKLFSRYSPKRHLSTSDVTRFLLYNLISFLSLFKSYFPLPFQGAQDEQSSQWHYLYTLSGIRSSVFQIFILLWMMMHQFSQSS
jgi:hypothetical protein